jgi:hypothetical protein
MKKQTMSLQDFLKGNYETKKPHKLQNYSFIPLIPKMMFFNKPVLILACVGGLFIVASAIEHELVKNGNEVSAQIFSMIVSAILPIIGFGAICVLIGKAFYIFV